MPLNPTNQHIDLLKDIRTHDTKRIYTKDNTDAQNIRKYTHTKYVHTHICALKEHKCIHTHAYII